MPQAPLEPSEAKRDRPGLSGGRQKSQMPPAASGCHHQENPAPPARYAAAMTLCSPACPRCGYDLSGAVAAWEQSCPLTGVCSECGLELEWRRVLNPALTTPQWSFEHARSRRVRRMTATWLHALRPGFFWQRLHMEHEIHPRRLVVFAAVMLLLAHAACALAQAWEVHIMASGQWGIVTGQGQQSRALIARAAIWPYDRYQSGFGGEFAGMLMGITLCLALGAPLALVVLPDTFRLARVRQLHILRGSAYGLGGAAAAIVLVMLVQGATASVRAMNFGQPPSLAVLVNGVILLAALLWYIAWWCLFIGVYLRLPRAWLVAIVTLFLAMLLAFTVAAHIETSDAF